MSRGHHNLLLLLVLAGLLVTFYTVKQGAEPSQESGQDPKSNILDGCYHVYLDMGTNRGVQIRKLYEPHLFPGASVLPIFDKHFGAFSTRQPGQVCAVGFEPNWEHEKTLEELEQRYKACGWPVKMFTRTGVGVAERSTKFANINSLLVKGADGKSVMLWFPHGLLGRLVEGDEEGEKVGAEGVTTVQEIRISHFINTLVATRRLPPAGPSPLPPAVVMKLDVEGREVSIVPDLVMSGALRHLANLHVDWTVDSLLSREEQADVFQLADSMAALTRIASTYNLTHVSQVTGEDDEMYLSFDGALPQC